MRFSDRKQMLPSYGWMLVVVEFLEHTVGGADGEAALKAPALVSSVDCFFPISCCICRTSFAGQYRSLSNLNCKTHRQAGAYICGCGRTQGCAANYKRRWLSSRAVRCPGNRGRGSVLKGNLTPSALLHCALETLNVASR